MSGEVVYINYKKLLQEESAKFTQAYNSTITNINKSKNLLKEMMGELTEIKKKTESELNSLHSDNFELFKDEKIQILTELSGGIVNSVIQDAINKSISNIRSSSDLLDIIKQFTATSVEIEFALKEVEKKNCIDNAVIEMFGIKDITNASEEQMSMLLTYKKLKEEGYNPVYDLEDKKIIVLKDNNDQIIIEEKKSDMVFKFNDYEGRTCSKDMLKIEKILRNGKMIPDNAEIYTNWYSDTYKQEKKHQYVSDIKKFNELKTKQGSSSG